MELIEEFDTNQCHVLVYKTGYACLGIDVFCIESRHLANGKILVRFGTSEQINQICNTYKKVNR